MSVCVGVTKSGKKSVYLSKSSVSISRGRELHNYCNLDKFHTYWDGEFRIENNSGKTLILLVSDKHFISERDFTWLKRKRSYVSSEEFSRYEIFVVNSRGDCRFKVYGSIN